MAAAPNHGLSTCGVHGRGAQNFGGANRRNTGPPKLGDRCEMNDVSERIIAAEPHLRLVKRDEVFTLNPLMNADSREADGAQVSWIVKLRSLMAANSPMRTDFISRPPFGLTEVTVAVRTLLLSCRKAGKLRIFKLMRVGASDLGPGRRR